MRTRPRAARLQAVPSEEGTDVHDTLRRARTPPVEAHLKGPGQVVSIAVVAWLLLAAAAGAAGLLEGARPPVPQVVLVFLTLAALHVLYRWDSFRSWGLAVDLRVLVAFHLTRFVGFEFLRLHRAGVLPAEFALTAGWGDIVVAVGAVALLLAGPPAPRLRPWYLAWNAAGLLDILFVVATATRLALADPSALAPLLRFPLSLLITFVVPIVIATHVWLFRRLVARGTPGSERLPGAPAQR